MLGYYMRLAFKSFRRNPGLSALMVTAIALGIAVCVMMMTMYHAMSGNPIWWKGDQLYTVTMDSWALNNPADESLPNLPPPQMSYRDAENVFASDIPTRKVIMYRGSGVLTAPNTEARPLRIFTRLTTSDFFAMFDTPFLYGGGWRPQADTGPEPVIVLTRQTNDKLFGGANSVGQTVRWNDLPYRVVGVLDHWLPMPKFYDLNNGDFKEPEEAFIPFGWGKALEHYSAGSTNCWKAEELPTFTSFLASECIWLQMWVELPDAASRERMQTFLDNYWAEQRRGGRFERPRNNRLTNVPQWLIDREVIQADNRVMVGLAFAFLAVCLINTSGLLLAKFLNGARITGVRRALGASRKAIFMQHLTEVSLLAGTGAVLGLGLGALGLWGLRTLYTLDPERMGGYQALAHVDTTSVVVSLGLAVFASLAAGIYPAWRIGRLAPASYLKSQ